VAARVVALPKRHQLLEIVMQARHRISLFLLSFTLAAANVASAAFPEYRVTVVGPANSSVNGINNDGVVVGTYPVRSGVTHGYLNRGRGLVDLGALGGRSSDAQAINDRGEVLGNWINARGQQRGYVYRFGRQRDIGIVPGRLSTFIDINNAGYILAQGLIRNSTVASQRSYLRAPDGNYRNIGTLPAQNPVTFGLALNNRNQITGQSGPELHPDPPLRAFIWNRGVIRDLDGFGFPPKNGQAINDRGQITGYTSVTGSIHTEVAFLYRNGRMINIDGRPDTDPNRFSGGEGINNHGYIVGTSNHLSGFIYRGRRMESLNSLIDPKLGWNISFPRAINDAGQIAAIAFRGGVQYAVRLDLIRPSALSAPVLEPDDQADPISQLSPAEAAAQARAEAEAAAREVVRPVAQ
jgi:probable HAF family extracellular repeat protein